MEQNLPVITKKAWNIICTAFFLLRKGISKGKLMAELNMLFKRWKIARKAIQNLMSHHSHHWSAAGDTSGLGSHEENLSSEPFPYPTNEYEFSCSNSPAYPNFHLPFHLNKRRKSHRTQLFSPSPADTEEDFVTITSVVRTLEKLNSASASPALPGFGKSPMVKQLRITDSPFPVRDADEDNHVDEAAEKFIRRFYKDLRRQNS